MLGILSFGYNVYRGIGAEGGRKKQEGSINISSSCEQKSAPVEVGVPPWCFILLESRSENHPSVRTTTTTVNSIPQCVPLGRPQISHSLTFLYPVRPFARSVASISQLAYLSSHFRTHVRPPAHQVDPPRGREDQDKDCLPKSLFKSPKTRVGESLRNQIRYISDYAKVSRHFIIRKGLFHSGELPNLFNPESKQLEGQNFCTTVTEHLLLAYNVTI